MPLLFSYGTLQLDSVQLASFGRLLAGSNDRLPGYTLQWLTIDDPQVVTTSGASRHPIARRSREPGCGIDGVVFEVTDEELASADRYEVPAYRRILANFVSGRSAWVYVDASE